VPDDDQDLVKIEFRGAAFFRVDNQKDHKDRQFTTLGEIHLLRIGTYIQEHNIIVIMTKLITA
tara:strand:+ start:1133 stop:1321 length:189 start_codon:yes stop_codon:yes gene_type:complete